MQHHLKEKGQKDATHPTVFTAQRTSQSSCNDFTKKVEKLDFVNSFQKIARLTPDSILCICTKAENLDIIVVDL